MSLYLTHTKKYIQQILLHDIHETPFRPPSWRFFLDLPKVKRLNLPLHLASLSHHGSIVLFLFDLSLHLAVGGSSPGKTRMVWTTCFER